MSFDLAAIAKADFSKVDLGAAEAAAKPYLDQLLDDMKTSFMSAFGSWVESAHRDRLETLFKEAGQVKLKLIFATPEEQIELQDIYATKIASLETLGLAIQIVGEAKAVSVLKTIVNQALAALPAIAGAVVSALASAAVPGLGAAAGPLAALGVQALVSGLQTKIITA